MDVIRGEHMAVMKDEAILCNIGQPTAHARINVNDSVTKSKFDTAVANRSLTASSAPTGRTRP
jgi:S-adenosylhomocysteine hydrolase